MENNQPAAEFPEYARRNNALRLLAGRKGALDERLAAPFAEIIRDPMSIEDPHSFASLLVKMDAELFIDPLIDSISTAVPGESNWLADYMYALIILLMNREDCYPVTESFVHLLGGWLLSTGGGEISWKAGDLLAEVENQATRDYLIRGISDESLFSETRIACMRGIVNQYREDAEHVLSAVANDPDLKLRDASASALKHIKKGQAKTKQ